MTGEDLAAGVLAGTSALVLLLHQDGTVVQANPAAGRVLGLDPAELVGRDAAALLARPRDVVELRQALRGAHRSGEACVLESRLPASATSVQCTAWAVSPMPDTDLLVLVGIDVSSTRSQLDDLQSRALTDELTGLGNRAQLMLTMQRLSGTGATVVFCDLNGFKAVNDTHGHAAGDAVLVEVARRFQRAVRGEDLVVRLGGDEFVIVAPASPSSDAGGLRRRVAGALRQPMLLGGGLVVMVGVAIGVAELEPGADPERVLQQADSEMYAAKGPRAVPVAS